MAPAAGEPPAKSARTDEGGDEEADPSLTFTGSVELSRWIQTTNKPLSTTLSVLRNINLDRALCSPSVEAMNDLLSDICADGRLYKLGCCYEDALDRRMSQYKDHVDVSLEWSDGLFLTDQAVCVCHGIKTRERAELLETAGIKHLKHKMKVGVNILDKGVLPNSVITDRRTQAVYVVPVVDGKFTNQDHFFQERAKAVKAARAEEIKGARRQPPPGNFSATARLILDSLFEEGGVWPEDPDNVAAPLMWKDAGKDLQAFAAKRVRKELWESSGYEVDLWTAAEETRLYIKSKRTTRARASARPGPAPATLGLQYCLDPKSEESLNQLARFRAQKQPGEQ
ncbi:hypothetical protein HKI87_09g57830 [Chloropicon roscoffensis]|uniref:Uncharacterized protein n=1 Tax=Chloropicon roscoffensis TaxID=1461544 RepID=A0AAX4PDH7_9CHLO